MKKFIIVLVCITAIAVCLGLPNRVTKTGIDTALSYPSASVEEVTNDVELLTVAAFIVERFPESENGFFITSVLYDTDGVYSGLQVSYKTSWGTGTVKIFGPDEISLSAARKAANVFKPLAFDWFADDEGVLDAVDTIAHFFALLYVAVEVLLVFLFDTFFAALGLVRGALYLLGF